MSNDTNKATARPWQGDNETPWLYDVLYAWVSAKSNELPEGDDRDGKADGLYAQAHEVLERVNGWDALVAERDRLREALRKFQTLVEATDIAYRAGAGATPAECKFMAELARAALEGGKA